MRKTILTLLSLLLAATVVNAEENTANNKSPYTNRIKSLKSERWWGGYSALGRSMPFHEKTGGNLVLDNKNNQSVPFLISSEGRYVWSDTPFSFRADREGVGIKSNFEQVNVMVGGKSLREGYLIAAQRHFKSSGKSPAPEMFSMPQYNTWMEMAYDLTQEKVIEYARAILSNGFPCGIIIIDDNWQRYHGSFSFDGERFPDPKGMVDTLHSMGFKVMAWVSPFVSPDSPEYRRLSAEKLLIMDGNGDQPAIIRWWNGHSACYDMTNPSAQESFKASLRSMQEKYGIDGFKFDGGDTNSYTGDITSFDTDALPCDHNAAWSMIGVDFPFNEYRASYGGAGLPLAERLCDKDCTWDGLASIVPDMIALGLMGYPYGCADMIGGGQIGSDSYYGDNKPNEMILVRWAQAQAMMPMMQFSTAPWNVLEEKNIEACRKAALLHVKMAPYIATLVQEAEQTGAPIVRAMEYEFPNQGFADCNDQFMLGSKYLVAPVTSSSSVREVRLPAGRWKDDMGTAYKGPLVLEIDVAADRLLYFERVK